MILLSSGVQSHVEQVKRLDIRVHCYSIGLYAKSLNAPYRSTPWVYSSLRLSRSYVRDILNMATSNFDLSALKRRFAGVRSLEDLLEFLQGLASCFNEEEEDECDLDTDPGNVDDV